MMTKLKIKTLAKKKPQDTTQISIIPYTVNQKFRTTFTDYKALALFQRDLLKIWWMGEWEGV